MSPLFLQRAALLLGLMAVMSGTDFALKGRRATRHREYGFILLAALIAGTFGFCNDLITSTISPDYFVLGKGLEKTDGLRMQAGLYGLQSGFAAGAVAGAICLFVCRGNFARHKATYKAMVIALWIPLATAILFAVIFPVFCSSWDPLHLTADLGSLLSQDQLARFREVWWIHMGLYIGLIVGLGWMLRKISKGQKFT